jgi:hypothetical protein
MTTVVNIKSGKPYDIYIGRPSKWGNPFRIRHDQNRAEVIEWFERYLRSNINLRLQLPELRGKVLGCYCKPLDCHGDVLIKLLHEIYGE